jgi:hypothetical protein
MKSENRSQGVALGYLIVVPLALEDRLVGCFYDVGNHRPVVGFSSLRGHNQDVGKSTPTVCHAIACGYAPGSFDCDGNRLSNTIGRGVLYRWTRRQFQRGKVVRSGHPWTHRMDGWPHQVASSNAILEFRNQV